MNCETCEELLSAWLDEELSAWEQEACLAHLEACPACRAAWRKMQVLQAATARLPEPALPSNLWERIDRALPAAAPPGEHVICFTTARGRMISERSLVCTPPFSRRLSSRAG